MSQANDFMDVGVKGISTEPTSLDGYNRNFRLRIASLTQQIYISLNF